ncbi:MAG: hypothetical protein ATN32_05145 [Candidatus Epulonipiscium fishelsonii]|nr:MAG: hypothetical protein ATN32_05145 [Epulopiscium sp. AS2M-Bin002]
MQISKTKLKDNTKILSFKNDYVGNDIRKNKTFFENFYLKEVHKYVKDNLVIYDIGANIGNHSIYFSKYYKAKKIYSFEPDPITFKLLKKNIAINSISNIALYNIGLGDKNCNAEILRDTPNQMCLNMTKENVLGEIKIKKLDDLNIPLPQFIKIDVEGNEINVLKGMEKTLKKSKPLIWIETWDKNFNELDTLLKKLGFEIIDRLNHENYIYYPTKNMKFHLKICALKTALYMALYNYKKITIKTIKDILSILLGRNVAKKIYYTIFKSKI